MRLTLVAMVALLTGCAGTTSAYRAADTLEDTAYVVTEHYSAVLNRAADLRQNGVLRGEALEEVRAARDRLQPLFQHMPVLVSAYESVQSAENEEALADAVTEAIEALADFIRLVNRHDDNPFNGRVVFDLEEKLS